MTYQIDICEESTSADTLLQVLAAAFGAKEVGRTSANGNPVLHLSVDGWHERSFRLWLLEGEGLEDAVASQVDLAIGDSVDHFLSTELR
jgi:hypothetical protein